MTNKFKHLHLIDDRIMQSNEIHPFNDKNKNTLSDKQFFIKRLKKDLGGGCSYSDISEGKNNLFNVKLNNEEFNVFIEHCDAGGRDVSFNKPDMKVGIPFATKAFQLLIKNMKNALVIDIYYELKTVNGKLEVNYDKYCYLIVIPSEIYTSEVTYNILYDAKKVNQSSRGVTLADINKCINTGETLVNQEENVWLVNPMNIKRFLLGIVLDDYKNQFKKSYFKLLELLYDKQLSDEKRHEINNLRAQLRKEIIKRGKCEIFTCDCRIEQSLVASHIGPVNRILSAKNIAWVDKKKYVRDPNNAFLLCGTHDKLLDKFLITFDDNGKLIPSKILETSIESYNFGDILKPVIKISKENLFYLKKHREIFYEYELSRIKID